ncbi:MAG: enoyl-CoA hydratase/isomerase family protein [Alphaproteobacteria bacterium]
MSDMFNIETKGPIMTVTMSRPPMNAISPDFAKGLSDVIDQAAANKDLSVLHLRSDQRFFSAGADLAYIETVFAMDDPAKVMAEFVADLQNTLQRLEDLPILTIAEINGGALGGGFEIALACSLRVAADDAVVGLPEAHHGLIPGAGGTQRLTRLCGRGVSGRVILTGEMVKGADALRMGMVEWSVPADKLAETAAGIAQGAAKLEKNAVGYCKRCIAAQEDPAQDGFAVEREVVLKAIASDETQRRVAAFVSKNK